MNGRLKTLMSENVALEAQHEEDLAVAENAHERERSFLNRKAEKLHSQVRQTAKKTFTGPLLAGTRIDLYWTFTRRYALFVHPRPAGERSSTGPP